MLIDEPAVLVPHRLAQPLLELAVAELQRRRERGHPIPDDLRRLLGDLAVAARAELDRRGPQRAAARAAEGRTPTMDAMTTRTAAATLGINERTVRKRIAAGRLDAERTVDGNWIVYLPSTTTRSAS